MSGPGTARPTPSPDATGSDRKPSPGSWGPFLPLGTFDLPGWYLIARVMRNKQSLPRRPPRLVDLGMGRGRDLIYFARRGFRVRGIDLDRVVTERAGRRAARLRVSLPIQLTDLRSVQLRGRFDVVFSNCTLNFLPPEERGARFAHFQAVTEPGGLHAVNAFLTSSTARPFPDLGANAVGFRPKELVGYYRDWEILESSVQVFDLPPALGGRRHRLEVVVARKPSR